MIIDPTNADDRARLDLYIHQIARENEKLRAELEATKVNAGKTRVGLQLVLTEKERAERQLANLEAAFEKQADQLRGLASQRDAAVSRADIATNWMGHYIAEEEAADDALDALPETLRPAQGPLDQRVRSLASKLRNTGPFVMAEELQRVKQALAKVNEERRNAPHVSVAMAHAAIADAAADARRNALAEVAQSLAKMQETQAHAREQLREPNNGKSYS
jgi:hypothetical protein